MKKGLLIVGGSLAVAALFLAATASAQTTTPIPTTGQGGWGGRGGMMHRMPGVFGAVSAVSGSTLTVTSKGFGKNTNATPTMYTIDASSATVTKDGASSSLSNVAVGDMVMVQGTVTGTSVTATAIHDLPAQAGGMPKGGMMGGPGGGKQAAMIQGNGQPVIGGNVSAINGSSLTVTNKSNITYSVDATNATVLKGNATSSLSAIAVGDNVVVQGGVNGTAVSASSIIDSGVPPATSGGGNSGSGMPMRQGGFLGMVGGFFQRIFGFF